MFYQEYNQIEFNFVNIDYEPFNSSDWEIRDAGLPGLVELRSYSFFTNTLNEHEKIPETNEHSIALLPKS